MEDLRITIPREEVDAPVQDEQVAGIRALWLKVIIRAAFDYVQYKDSNELAKRKYFESAHVWLFEPSELFNSFESICECLDIDAQRIRGWVRSLSKEQIAKIEHLDRGPTLVKMLLNGSAGEG